MKNIFDIFRKKRRFMYDCETESMDGEKPYSNEDIIGILQMTKRDHSLLTKVLNSFPVGHPLDAINPAVKNQRTELWDWNTYARTIHYDVGIDIENLERIMYERIPSLKDTEIRMNDGVEFATD